MVAVVVAAAVAAVAVAEPVTCPPLSKPASNSPFRAEITRTPTSAWHAPAIMLGT